MGVEVLDGRARTGRVPRRYRHDVRAVSTRPRSQDVQLRPHRRAVCGSSPAVVRGDERTHAGGHLLPRTCRPRDRQLDRRRATGPLPAPGSVMKYDFGYEPGSSYAQLVALLDAHAPRGLVIDLGCGAAQIAAPLRELGFEYAGADVDTESLTAIAERGIEGHAIDLGDLDALPDAVTAIAGGRTVAAITLLDVLEHLPDPQRALTALGDALRAVDGELLGLSVPNVAHSDLAAQLLMGRWEVTDTGLLDRTHLSLFTDRRLADA